MPDILAESNFIQEMKIQVHYQVYMHHISQKVKQFIHSLEHYAYWRRKKERKKKERKKKDEQNVWTAISRTPTSNMITVKFKAAVNADASVHHV